MKPYVICHMISSIDGRIKADGCPQEYYTEYQYVENLHDADGWMCGRVSMEDFTGKTPYVKRDPNISIPKTDHMAPHTSQMYAFAIDPLGKLDWKMNTIYDSHLVSVLTEKVTEDYLAFLQEKGISYIFCGKEEINLHEVLKKMYEKFQIKKLLLEGGGTMNGSMLQAGLVDEVSLLVAPVIEGSIGGPTIFDMSQERKLVNNLKLISVKELQHHILWLSYSVMNHH